METKKMTVETTARQRKYVEDKEKHGHGLGLVFADAFLRGMRDIGYKSPAWAMCEMIDNSVQAQAHNIEVLFGEFVSERGGEQPGQIAIVDDGVGMIPKMISYAVRWGGTDRENDRNGFGRYGYGLPSSAVSMACKYAVYSKTKEGTWHKVSVDIHALADVAGDVAALERALQPVPAKIPSWVLKANGRVDLKSLESGTVIVLEKLDRLAELDGWRTAKSLKAKLLESFGMIYRHLIPEPRLFVDGDEALAVDPLFLMEHARFFDENEVRAQRVEARTFTVVASTGEEAPVTIKASYLPPNFQLVDPKQYGMVTDDGTKKIKKKGTTNRRFSIMKETNGLIICRDGRQIDIVPPWFTTFQNLDRNIKIEIDFDPRLDEFFGITTAKQQITIEDSMKSRLTERGQITKLVDDLRKRRDADDTALKAAAQNAGADEERPSEQAMRESEKFKVRPHRPTEQQEAEAERNLEVEATKIAEQTRQGREAVIAEMEAEAIKRPYKIDWQAVEEGPFYRPVRVGDQKRLVFNTNHPFYSRVYETVGPEAKAAIEVMLWVLAESELEAGTPDASQFYKSARNQWSERLRNALEALRSDQDIHDAAAAAAESMEVQTA